MQVEKKHLEIFFQALKGTEGVLSLKESRIRDAFMKPLGEATETFYKERTAIYEQFCDKTEDGKPDITDNKYHFKQEVLEEVNKELLTLANETVDLNPHPEIKEIMEKTTYSPKYGETEVIDEILSKL